MPPNTLIFLGYQSRGGVPSLTATVGYVCERDGSLVNEQAAWAWLNPQFPNEPFDNGQKRTRGTFAMAGLACAPAGTPVQGLTISATVGDLHKQLLVQGDRHWVRGVTGWHASAPEPFSTMPIALTHAYGAQGYLSNPYGRGHLAEPDKADGQALPNIEHPQHPMLKPSDVVPVGTFGQLPQGSSDLTRWLGTFDKAWERERLPWLPDDTDARWFDGVSQDQCITSFWRGDEAWSAINMHAELQQQSGTLPGLRPRLFARAQATSEECREIPLDLDTVWLFPNDSRVILLYRTEIATLHEDASDIGGLAVFTEWQRDPALSREHYAQLWEQKRPVKIKPVQQPAPTPAPDGEAVEVEAKAKHMAAIAEKLAADRASIIKEVDASHNAALDQAEPMWKSLGMKGMREKFPPPSSYPDEPLATAGAPLSVQEIHAQVDAALKQAEDQARAHLANYGIDMDAAVTRAQAQPQVKPDPVAMIAAMPISAAKKEELTTRMKTFMREMDAVEKEATRLEAEGEKLRADRKAAADAAAAEEDAEPEEGVLPKGPRRVLNRDELISRHRAGRSAAWTSLDGADLSGLDLSGVDLSRAHLHACLLRGTILDKAKLTEIQLEDCDLTAAHLNQAQLQRAQMTDCRLDNALASSADLTQARVSGCAFTGATLDASQWNRADVQKCHFGKADMSHVQANHSKFSACDLGGTDATGGVFERANFEKCVLDAACFEQTSLIHATLFTCQAVATRFAQARMSGLRTLQQTDMRQARLDGADLTRASLQDTVLKQASLRETCLDQAYIKDCDLSATDGWHMRARQADFTGSRIVNASWRGANLMRARFARAILEDVDFSGTNLHAASTRTATAQGVLLHQALLTRCRLVEEHT